ncbi:Uncharacterised protein [uncultured archaeon]|nr:Uncharacterised protein [uncultured archaeon]
MNSEQLFGVANDSQDNIAAAGAFNVGAALDVFVGKFAPNGTQLWNVTAGSVRSEWAEAVAVDSLDNIIAGGFFQQATLQPDGWLLKYNSSGNPVWNVTFGNINRPDYVWDVAVDSANNITAVGYNETAGTVGGKSIFLWKYNSSGSQLWNTTLRAPGTADSEAMGVDIDSSDNITITGYMFIGGVSQVFTAKLTSAGAMIKNVTFNNTGAVANIGSDIVIDSNNNIIVAGQSNFGGGSIPVAIVVKYDSNLNHLWNVTYNGSGGAGFGDIADSVAVDDENNIYISGISNRSILLVKYDVNGNQLWNLTSAFGTNDRGWADAIDSKNFIIIGGRTTSSTADDLLLKYYGFENLNQTQGVIVNSSTIDASVTEVGDVWMCDARALDATAKTTYLDSNNLTIRDSVPASVECSINAPNNFTNCSNLVFFDNITQVRANCSGAVNATFNLTNLYDNTNFIYNTTSTSSGDFMVLDNADVQILDSGNWSLSALCDFGTIQGNAAASFFIPFGNITNAQMLTGNLNVPNGQTFTINTRLQCTGGECVNISVVLDPIQFSTNLTDPTNEVHSVFADSEFIYGASEDANLYIYNKTSLGLFATLSDSSALQALHVDSQYIYAGGTGQTLRIWNRTDIVTPFNSVFNSSGLGSDIISINSDSDNIYVGFKTAPGLLRVFNKTTFVNYRNLSGPAAIVRDLAVDNTSLYAGTHNFGGYGHLFIYNRSNLSQSPVNLGSCALCDVKVVQVDDSFIYLFGHDFTFRFLIVYYKSNFTVAFNTSYFDVLSIAGDKGGFDFLYTGGPDPGFTDGKIIQANKTNYSITDEYNITGWWPTSLFCDESYLYAGMMDNGYSLGMISLFNNPCLASPSVPITINSLAVVPSIIPAPSSAYCSANITTPGTIDNVTFTVTYPDGIVLSLNVTNSSDIFNSSNFTVNVTGAFLCNVTANNTAGTSANASLQFDGGQKGAIPMNAGAPFYTTSQNPRNGSHQACLQSLIPGQNCDSSWSVVANATVGQTYLFFAAYTGSDLNTSGINVTITEQPTPPAPSGGGGGGGNRYIQITPPVIEAPSGCYENWACGDWSDCVNGVRTRKCYDSNNCITENLKPIESQNCSLPVPVVQKTIPAYEKEELSPAIKKPAESATPVQLLILKIVLSSLAVLGIIILILAAFYWKR